MSVTEKLLKVYRIDQQINGLQGRLRAAERFLAEQDQHLRSLTERHTAISGQLKQVSTVAADAEGEMARLDERIDQLRERMNTAKTSKEYKAVLAEVTALKDQRSAHEQRALEMMEKAEAIRGETAQLGTAAQERQKVRGAAAGERDRRADEIREKLAELKTERADLAAAVNADALSTYEALVKRLEDEAMAPIEVQDRKRHEYTCGACMMSLPVETMSTLLGSGALTLCVSCGCILFLDETAKTQMLSSTSSKR